MPSVELKHVAWFIRRGKKIFGPYRWANLLAFIDAGKLSPRDLVQPEGQDRWWRAEKIPGLFTSPAPKESKTPPSPNRPRVVPYVLAALLVVVLGVAAFRIVYGPIISGHSLLDPLAVTIEPATKLKSENVTIEDPQGVPPKLDPSTSSAPNKVPVAPNASPPKEKSATEKVAVSTEPTIELSNRFVTALNTIRKQAGLASVQVDPDSSKACQAHAQYLAWNGPDRLDDASFVHSEDPSKKGFTSEGRKIAPWTMAGEGEPEQILADWMARFFNRVPLLSPDLLTFGVGWARSESGKQVLVMEGLRGRGDSLVVYPAPDQKDVPLSFSGGPELPDPKISAGFPVTVTFPPTWVITKVKAELRENGTVREAWLSTPEQPLLAKGHRNTVALIPKQPLRGLTVYEMHIHAEVDGQEWERRWTFTTEDGEDRLGHWRRAVFSKVNQVRRIAGLPEVTLDEKLSQACLAHARYLALNIDHEATAGLGAHDEDLSLPGASVEGKKAGLASDIAIGDITPAHAVEAWCATLYHRVPILDPGLKSVGFGCIRGRRLGWISVLDVSTGRTRIEWKDPVIYPVADQNDVPIHFPTGGEEPNPIPDDRDGKAGYPITVTFGKETLNAVQASLRDAKGEVVPIWLSSPEKPANPTFARHQGTTVCLIAKDPLKPKSEYEVEVRGKWAGKPWERKWKFRTSSQGASDSKLSELQIERINFYRQKAGLATVVLDPQLSKGCQAHAEYLVKNSEELTKRKLSLNSEEPSLPGYTAEGLLASRRSDVLSNTPSAITQIDDLMATFSRRVYLLDPTLRRVGFGTAQEVGKGWRCVLDMIGGRGEERVILFPAPKQEGVPLVGGDRLSDVSEIRTGFPITVTFPARLTVRSAQAILTDADGKEVDIHLSSPERPLHAPLQRNTICVHPRVVLLPASTYSITVSAVVAGREWRQTWQFTTRER